MRLAILSDIHANREAFSAVMDDMAQRGCDRLVILGDVVGYGPDPVWCLQRVRALQAEGAVVLQGNHDAAIETGTAGMNPVARAALDWTRAQLDPQARAWLAGLPLTAEVEGITLAHASPAAPATWPYVLTAEDAAPAFAATPARLILVGHVHVPLLVSQDRAGLCKGFRPRPGQPQPLLPSRRWLAVVGSVGQPRDGDAAAGYATLDTDRAELTFRKVPYDSLPTLEKLGDADLPRALAIRLLTGD